MYKEFNVQNRLSLADRLQAPTPKFFKKVRAIGITLGAIGTALVSSGVELPASITNIGGYLITAGAVIAAVTATTVDYKELSMKGLK